MPQTKNPEADHKLIQSLQDEDSRSFDQALREGASVNAYDSKLDRTALMLAAEKGMVEQIEKLIESGADVNARNSKGQTAFEFAINRKATWLDEFDDLSGQRKYNGAAIIAQSAYFDPNIPLSNGWAPLRAASMRQAEGAMDAIREKLGPAPEEPVVATTAAATVSAPQKPKR